MKHEESNYLGIHDTDIYYQNWSPDTDPKGVLIIVHGFGEHSGRYMNVVNTVVPSGIAVYALDHRGHGKSGGKINYVNRFTDYFADIELLQEIVETNHPGLPLFMLGHSMGSLIATNFMAQADQSKYTAFVLSGTGSASGPGINGFTIFLAKVLSVIAPKLSIPSNLDPNFISHDEEVIDDYVNDPLVHYDKISTRLGAEMIKNTASMKTAAAKIKLPTLVQVGEEDDTFTDEAGLIAAFPNEKKELKVYQGYRHEIYNEVNKEVPLKDLNDWLLSFF